MKKFLVFVLFCFLATGCASVQTGITNVTEDIQQAQKFEKKTVAEMIKMQRSHKDVLSPEIEFFKGYLGKQYEAMPLTLVDAIRELQALSKQPNLTDDQVAYMAGLEIRIKSILLSDLGRQISKTLLPILGRDVIQVLSGIGFLP